MAPRGAGAKKTKASVASSGAQAKRPADIVPTGGRGVPAKTRAKKQTQDAQKAAAGRSVASAPDEPLENMLMDCVGESILEHRSDSEDPEEELAEESMEQDSEPEQVAIAKPCVCACCESTSKDSPGGSMSGSLARMASQVGQQK